MLAAVCSPTSDDTASVEACLAAVERQARELLPDIRAHLFGSQAVGLAIPGSDIDMVLLSPTKFSDSLSDFASNHTRERAKEDKVPRPHTAHPKSFHTKRKLSA